MWLRKVGVPPMWPSRVKVIFTGFLKSCVILTIFHYLQDANISYLDVTKPARHDMTCRYPNEACVNASDPARCTQDADGKSWVVDSRLRDHCDVAPDSVDHMTCRNLTLPLAQLMDAPSLRTATGGLNPLKVWSYMFLFLVLLEALSIVVHDIMLTVDPGGILTLYDMSTATPKLWKLLMAVQCNQLCYCHSRRWRRVLFVVVLPLWTFCQFVIFVVVTYPYSFLIFLLKPGRMSRIMVFGSNVFCMVWSAVFLIATIASEALDQSYTVLWSGVGTSGQNCVCSCAFPIKQTVMLRLLLCGCSVFLHSFSLAVLSVKGLRWAHWANMLSVQYAVPIGAFPVEWERPVEEGGGPWKWREHGQAVQAEPAFDPFCLMDEQPESGRTRVVLLPTPRQDESPKTPTIASSKTIQCTFETEPGCFGFPQPAAGSRLIRATSQ